MPTLRFSSFALVSSLLLASSAWAQEPAAPPAPAPANTPVNADYQEVSVRYHVVFDVDARGDQFCRFTGLCDCESVYVGAGRLQSKAEGRATFVGTWTAESNTCGENLTLWVPEDGRAHHTLRFAGSQVTEWIAHARADQTTRLQENIKSQGLVWLAPMAAALQGGKAHHQESETQNVGVGLSSTHTLDIALK